MLDIENSMLGNTTSAETGKPAQEVLIGILHRRILKRPNMSNCSMQRGFRYLLVSVIVIVDGANVPSVSRIQGLCSVHGNVFPSKTVCLFARCPTVNRGTRQNGCFKRIF